MKHKLDKVRETSSEELIKRLAAIRESLFRLNFKKALGDVDTVAQIRRERKEFARIKTILRGRALGVEK
ncbi:MAG TPA: 50S ribosomal protein L29 [Blastocatellia bacterium]|nr:50S ribosomal protein L29 [Blastocatellia bacterium]HMV85130.1 50S ribosomal protein L29 [Blastocatellia bacterium]HMX25658.1 50S ribosomal protein L29 [Blastocatellia bacterium]HMZ18623.1 50S ribosomal protein L29 [Blastocatellia bacterium]HNG33805.1 50S ribosomal protein L29 [Blastocatellia bacterium]